MTKERVQFRKLSDWAVYPRSTALTSEPKSLDVRVFDQFRWLGPARRSSECRPLQLARSLGWELRSPIDVELNKIQDFPFKCENADELDEISRKMGFVEIWKRDDCFVAYREPTGLKFYEFETKAGWESMFLPNGENSIEWRQGLAIELPRQYALLVCSLDIRSSLEILPGILVPAQLNRMNDTTGLSIAVRPHTQVRIRRGDVIARLLPICLETLSLGAEFE